MIMLNKKKYIFNRNYLNNKIKLSINLLIFYKNYLTNLNIKKNKNFQQEYNKKIIQCNNKLNIHLQIMHRKSYNKFKQDWNKINKNSRLLKY
jgi:hypothetical protein